MRGFCFWNHLHRPRVLTPGTLCWSAATRLLLSYARTAHLTADFCEAERRMLARHDDIVRSLSLARGMHAGQRHVHA